MTSNAVKNAQKEPTITYETGNERKKHLSTNTHIIVKSSEKTLEKTHKKKKKKKKKRKKKKKKVE